MSASFSLQLAELRSDPASMPRRADAEQSRCLVESALRILKDHARAGDRYLRMQTQRLIAADEARVG